MSFFAPHVVLLVIWWMITRYGHDDNFMLAAFVAGCLAMPYWCRWRAPRWQPRKIWLLGPGLVVFGVLPFVFSTGIFGLFLLLPFVLAYAAYSMAVLDQTA